MLGSCDVGKNKKNCKEMLLLVAIEAWVAVETHHIRIIVEQIGEKIVHLMIQARTFVQNALTKIFGYRNIAGLTFSDL